MLTLYGVYRSRATRNFWLLNELGVAAKTRPVIQGYRLSDPFAKDAPLNTLSPEFLAISAAGAIPVLSDGALVLTESLAINLYLARKFGGPLAPADEAENALMTQWALYGATAIETAALEISYAYARGEVGTPAGDAIVAAADSKLARPMAVLEAHLAAEPHMVGGRFTVADINMAEIIRYAQPHAPLMARAPQVARWLSGCQARQSFRTMWAAREAEPI